MNSFTKFLLVLNVALAVVSVGAQEALRFTRIELAPAQSLKFTVTGGGASVNTYALEYSPILGTNITWTHDTNAVLTPLGGGLFQLASPAPPSATGFYRVVGFNRLAPVTAQFASTALQVEEGAGTVKLTILFSAPVHGVLNYSVSGTAGSGDFQPLSGSVVVNGTSAMILVTLNDNSNIDRLKSLTLVLQPGPGFGIGADGQATIAILENDAEWQGSFSAEGATLGFILKIQESNGVKVASLKSDRFGFFPTNEIPASLLFTTGQFTATVASIPLPASATLLNEPLRLTFFLSAMNGQTNQNVSPTQVQGIGALITEVPAKPFLNMTNFGDFQLLKPPVQPSTNQVQLADLP
ncbi:MAG: hypothetical protein L0Y58_13480 [Verrucomicrobia subdivision 3 bacterium]|nr:hypothetical protein [Limisphaerales bacterium]